MSRFRTRKTPSSMPGSVLGIVVFFILCLQGCLGNGQGYPGSKNGAQTGAPDSSALLPERSELMISCLVTGTGELLRLYQNEESEELSAVWKSTATQGFDDIIGEKLAETYVFSSTELSLTLETPTADSSIVSGFYEALAGTLQIESLDVDGDVDCSVSKEFLDSFDE